MSDTPLTLDQTIVPQEQTLHETRRGLVGRNYDGILWYLLGLAQTRIANTHGVALPIAGDVPETSPILQPPIIFARQEITQGHRPEETLLVGSLVPHSMDLL